MKENPADPITLCIINYNGKKSLQQALAATGNLRSKFDEVLVIDNASTDDSLAYLNTLPEIRVVALDANTGPGGARNAGMKHAGNDVILFQDNDISLTEGVVQALYETLQQDKQILLTMPRVVYRSDPETIQFEGANCHILGMMSLRCANMRQDQLSKEIVQTSSMVSACFMIDRHRWQKDLRLFDEDFIFNLEDHDLGVRASLLGYQLLAVPSAVVLHGSGTAGYSYRPGREVSAIRMYCLIRNRWWIIVRYFSTRTLLVMGPLLLLFEIMQLTVMVFKGWGSEWWRAFVDTGKQWPKLVKERKQYQQLRQRADPDILQDGTLPLTDAMGKGGLVHFGTRLFEVVMHIYWRLARKLL